jgi:shikimate kinase
MADNEQAFADLRRILAERDPLYRQAELVVDTSAQGVEQSVERIVAGLGAQAA